MSDHMTDDRNDSMARPDGHVSPAETALDEVGSPGWRRLSRGQLQAISLIVALAGFSLMYRAIVWRHLKESSLMFIGLPAFLAVVLAAAPRAKTLAGTVMRGMTFALLLSGVLLGEGFICIVMAAPLFYLVALLVVGCMQWWRNRRTGLRRTGTLSCVVLIMLPMMLEGTTPWLSLPRENAVTVSEVVDATPAEVRERLAAPLRMSQTLPMYLRLRFPRPVGSSGSGLHVGDERTVHFAKGEGEPGDLSVRVDESEAGHVQFRAVSDTSRVAHWLRWETAEIDWVGVDARHTRVTCTLRYERRLDPAWYFGPWQWYAARKTAGYLIAANAGPGRHED